MAGTSFVSLISFTFLVMVIAMSSGTRVASQFGQFWARNRQPVYFSRWLDLPRSRGVSGKTNNDQFLPKPTFSGVGQHGDLKNTMFPIRSSRDTSSVHASFEDVKKETNHPGFLVSRPNMKTIQTGHVHHPEAHTELLRAKQHNRMSERGTSTAHKSKRDIAWIYHRQSDDTNNRHPGNTGEEFQLLNEPRELVDTIENKEDDAMHDATVASPDGEAWRGIGKLVAAVRKSRYGVSFEVQPSEDPSETDDETTKTSKQKLDGKAESDAKETRSENEDDAVDSDNKGVILNTDPILVWSKRGWVADPLRIWGKRASETSTAWDKRPWDTDTVRVWGKRAWEIDPVRVWGKRAWEMDPVRVWGKRAWEMDPIRVWGKRAWEMDPVRVWSKRAWEMDPVRVWGKRAWEMDPVRVWGKRAWEMDPVRVWGKRAWEMDPVRVWGKRAWEMDPVRVWGKRAWEMDPVRVWGKRD